MQLPLKIFAILGLIFLAILFVACADEYYSLIGTFLIAIFWAPLCILTLVFFGKPRVKHFPETNMKKKGLGHPMMPLPGQFGTGTSTMAHSAGQDNRKVPVR